jgi:hypothetical protein
MRIMTERVFRELRVNLQRNSSYLSNVCTAALTQSQSRDGDFSDNFDSVRTVD